jgi:predicted MFS family arabinose efflux permease
LIGSLSIGYVVDRVENPQWVMAAVLAVLLATFLSIPILRSIPLVGLLPFLLWGTMGWSTMTPQQYRLSQLKPDRDATLVALNSSAASLGAVAGAALGGLALTAGFNAIHLPYLAAVLLFAALAWQLLLIQRQARAPVSS